jgi:hypothetical protein
LEKSACNIAISAWGRCLFSSPIASLAPLVSSLESENINLVGLADPSAEFYVALDYSKSALRRVTRIPKSNRQLFAFEPRAVNPAQYTSKVRSKFAETTVGSPLQVLSETDRVGFPVAFENIDQVRKRLEATNPELTIDEVVMLNENKFSFIPRSQYKMRCKAVTELAHAGWTVNIGGKNWDSKLKWQVQQQLLTMLANMKAGTRLDLMQFHLPLKAHPNIKIWGRIEDGIDFLGKYRVALAIENDPDYVSEKLFNAVAAGCIPIFVGAPLELLGIPADIAISVQGKDGDFSRALENLSDKKARSVLDAGRKWLLSEDNLLKLSNRQGLQRVSGSITTFVKKAH